MQNYYEKSADTAPATAAATAYQGGIEYAKPSAVVAPATSAKVGGIQYAASPYRLPFLTHQLHQGSRLPASQLITQSPKVQQPQFYYTPSPAPPTHAPPAASAVYNYVTIPPAHQHLHHHQQQQQPQQHHIQQRPAALSAPLPTPASAQHAYGTSPAPLQQHAPQRNNPLQYVIAIPLSYIRQLQHELASGVQYPSTLHAPGPQAFVLPQGAAAQSRAFLRPAGALSHNIQQEGAAHSHHHPQQFVTKYIQIPASTLLAAAQSYNHMTVRPAQPAVNYQPVYYGPQALTHPTAAAAPAHVHVSATPPSYIGQQALTYPVQHSNPIGK